MIHRLLEARPCEFPTFPTSRAGPGGREGSPGAGGKGALLPARERAGSEFSVSACPSLPWVYLALWGHHGGKGSSLHLGPGSPWPSLEGCRRASREGYSHSHCPCTGGVARWRSGGGQGRPAGQRLSPRDPLLPVWMSRPQRCPAGWPWVRRARWAKQGGVRGSCGCTVALSLLPPLPGLPPPLTLPDTGCPGTPRLGRGAASD